MVDNTKITQDGSCSIEYEDIIVKTAVKNGNGKVSSRVYLPPSWNGRHVVCLLINEDAVKILPKPIEFAKVKTPSQKE